MTDQVHHHPPRPGRPFNTSTPLGQLMQERGLRVKDVGFGTRINQRTLSDYLAGRRPMLSRHLALLSAYLQVSPAVLLGRTEVMSARGGPAQAPDRPSVPEPIDRWVSLVSPPGSSTGNAAPENSHRPGSRPD